jgi:GT2 family glycosyltransferase
MIEKSESGYGIAAVFVTMNRRETARTCLERLAAQTLRPERVLVIDNASTDGTAAMLAEAEECAGGWIICQKLDENVGNAGGMELALERMFGDGAQAVWILDDDSWPEPEALELLITADLPGDAVRSCRVVDLQTGALSWPLQVPAGGVWRFLETNDPLPDGETLRIRRSWLGALIPRQVYERVGRVTGELFLRGEDEDYPRRIEAAGFPVFLVSASLLHHPPSGPMKHWEIGGYTVVLENSLNGNPLYYRLRNSWWMIRRDRGNLAAAVVAILFALALLRWKESPSSWLPIWWEALVDAFSGRLGKRRE